MRSPVHQGAGVGCTCPHCGRKLAKINDPQGVGVSVHRRTCRGCRATMVIECEFVGSRAIADAAADFWRCDITTTGGLNDDGTWLPWRT